MAYREDEEKRIYELETAESLSAGTFVPVDKEGNEMAEKFDLGTALDEKVDVPSTAPEAGQVLTFDGTENGWKTVNEVPTSTSSDEGKVLTVDSNGAAAWTTGNNSVEIITANSTSTRLSEFTRIRAAGKIPALWYYGASFDGATHDVLCEWKYDTQSGDHVFLGSCIVTPDWNPHPRLYWVTYTQSSDFTSGGASYLGLTNIPQTTSSDSDKVLTVDSSGTPVWGQSGSSVMVVKYTSVPGSGAVFDKTFAEIKAALDNKIPVIMLGPNPNVTFDGQSTICTEYLVQTYTIEKIVFRSTLLANPYGESPNSAVSEIVLSSNDTIEYSKYVPLNFSLVSVYNTETITTSTYTIPKNNSWIPLIVDASVSSLTLNISNVDTLYPLPPNFAVEITPSAQLTLAVTITYHYDGNPDDVITLKHSVSAGNVLEAGKTYQVTVVGSCWTLAEFEA